MNGAFDSLTVPELTEDLLAQGYIADRGLATSVLLSLKLGKPLLLEGEVGPALAGQVVAAVNRLRDMDLEKPPGVAETIDWAESLDALGVDSLTDEAALDTLGSVVKDRDDLEYASKSIQDVVA